MTTPSEGMLLGTPRVAVPYVLRPRYVAHRATATAASLGIGLWLAFSDFASALVVGAVSGYPGLGAALAVGLVLAVVAGGMLRSQLTPDAFRQASRMLAAVLAVLPFAALVTATAQGSVPGITALVAIGLGVTLAAVLGRTILFAAQRQYRRIVGSDRRTVVVGSSPLAVAVATSIAESPDHGLRLVGVVSSETAVNDLAEAAGHRCLAPRYDLAHVAREYDVDTLVVAGASAQEEEQVTALLRSGGLDGARIVLVSPLASIQDVARSSDRLAHLPVTVRRVGAHPTQRLVKRAMDVVVAAAAILVLAPVMALVALAVRIEGGSGIIFRQERIGKGGQPFQLMKFRSMRPVNEGESQTQWSIANDPRVGPVGRFIRKTSLDELPQLVNVLRGDMSMVGPRPERPHFVATFSDEVPGYAARHRMPPGLTGFAAANGLRGDTSISERARLDNLYIDGWTLWLDVEILVRTPTALVKAPGS